MANVLPSLDAIARAIRATPLTEFVSPRAAAVRELRDDEVAVPDAEIEAARWFDAADALRTIQGLRDNLHLIEMEGPVASDLEEAAKLLGLAKRQGVRFRFAFDV